MVKMRGIKSNFLMLCLLLCSIQHVQSLQIIGPGQRRKMRERREAAIAERAQRQAAAQREALQLEFMLLDGDMRLVITPQGSLVTEIARFPHMPDAAYLAQLQLLIFRRFLPEIVPILFESSLTNAVANYLILLLVNYFIITHGRIADRLGPHRFLLARAALMILSLLFVVFVQKY